MDEFTPQEQTLMAAAYLKGLAVGLSIDRTKTWHKRVRNSVLAQTKLIDVAEKLIRTSKIENPLHAYEMRDFATRCGLQSVHHAACDYVQTLLTTPDRS